MRKRLLMYALLFTSFVLAVKMADIIIRYDIGIFDYIKYSMPLSADEKRYLQKNVIRYGIDVNDPPFAFVSGDLEQNTGIMVDYFNQLSIVLEAEFRPVLYNSYNLAVKLQTGSIDCSVLNMTNINKSVFSFTQPLYTEKSKILVDGESSCNSISDVSNMNIAVISGSTAHHAANEFFRERSNVNLVLTADLDESFRLFGLGEVDAIIGDEAKLSYHLNQALRANRFRFLDGSISEEDVAVAVNADQKVLFNILNKGILEMKKNNEYSHINSKWFGSFIPETDESSDGGNTANLVSMIIVFFAVFFIWNKSVANQVKIKTRQLKTSRQELRELIDSLKDGILLSDQEGHILAANKTFAGIIGIPFSDMLEKRVDEIEQLEPFLQYANSPEVFYLNNRYYLVYTRDLNEASNDNLILIKDYTERQKLERLNRQEAKMIAVGELSAGLAHEIRNPLGLIKNYLYVMKKRVDDESGFHALEVMNESVDRINLLIENLLGFSRLSSDKTTCIDVKKLLYSMTELTKKELENAGIRLDIDASGVDSEFLRVNGDILKLCIVNLTNNSFDAFSGFERNDKRILIKAANDRDNLYISFCDNAVGIERDALETVFNPFYTTKENGTGLGLYILQSEVGKTGGSISAESYPKKGTTFNITLPIERG